MRRIAGCWWVLVSLLIVGCAGTRRVVGGGAVAATHARSEIAVVRVRTGNASRTDIVLIGSEGGLRRVLVGASGHSFMGVAVDRVAWSPDGEWLAFTGIVGHRAQPIGAPLTDIFLVRANGSGLRRLTHTGSASTPVFSPDGHTIAFVAETYFKGTPNILSSVASSLWRVGTDGSGARPLTSPIQGQLDDPGSFSPDGTRLVFTRIKLIGFNVHSEDVEVIDSRGSGVQQLAAEGGEPAYSPDGRQIAFVSNRDHNGTVRTGEDESEYASELYVMDAAGQDPRRLTHTGELSEEAPSWSPDGTRLAYARQGEAFTQTVAVVNADGSCVRQVVADPRDNVSYRDPAWRPGTTRAGEGALYCGK